MCEFCDPIIKAKNSGNFHIVSSTLSEDKFKYRKFQLQKYIPYKDETDIVLSFDSDYEGAEMPIKYCPMCGNKLK